MKTSSGANKKAFRSIPDEALEPLGLELLRFNDASLDVSVRGRFCYVAYRGGPLCRLGYRGQCDVWDFAIYKYSTGSYGCLELAPTRDSPYECVSMALHAYGYR